MSCRSLPDIWNEEIYKYLEIEDVFKKSFDELVNFVVETINYFFPLVLIANYQNPLPAIEKHLQIWNPKYKLEKYVTITNIEYPTLKNWIKTLQRKKQIILQGSPGTGKTFIAENIAKYLIGGTDGFYDIIQFHPAYTYEDFIQGIRPETNNGQLEYNLVPGRFLEFCSKAESCNDNCILIIDEINRANLSSVFGELMYLLEYRDKEIYLAGSHKKFKIPSNVYIIGTMNTADRSIALVDFALRRRFAFITVEPNYEVIRKFHQNNNKLRVDGLITVLEKINKVIDDCNYSLGVSYFLIEDLASAIENIWRMEIEPYLEEYFYNSIEQVNEFRWDKIKDKILA
ncbi:MAG: AAA family ATPase [Xenococcaceae cyanobacterium MO_167.B27]|nr:AAA family ATPase [Xenococcaceae cyanobacterium MO_167.B27]